MLKNLHFDQTKKYERSIAANEIAKMLVAFIQGREHSLSIGAEQGEIDRWDDFVIEEANGTYKHIQVKDQQTDFSDDACVRDRYLQGPRKGQLRDLSPLDQCMKSLADWVKQNNTDSSFLKHRFIIELPDNTTHIKKEIQVRHFHTLCRDDIRSVTTAKCLEVLANKKTDTKNCFDWLTTWCDFSSWDHILKALRLLEINLSGNKNDIDRKTETILGDVFCKSSEVNKKIISYIDENSTFAGAITPRRLLKQLKSYLLPGITTWTQYQKVDSIWKISGIHDLECNEIERASFVVPSLWSNERVRHLKFDIPVGDSTKLSKNIVQLALHLQGQVYAHCTHWSAWKQTIKSLIGGTLGDKCTDCDILSLTENSSPFSAANSKLLHSRRESDGESDSITQEIIRATWRIVVEQLEQKIDNMQATSIRDTIEARWRKWKQELEQNRSEQATLFLRMLHAEAEGNDISADLRVGPKTASLIADGIYLLLIVSIGLSDTNTDWKTVGDDLSVNTIGLKCWSDPSISPRRVRDLDDEGVEMLINKEPSDVLILSQSRASSNEIFDASIASDSRDDNNLASPRRPQLLVTNTISFKKLITKGDINLIRRHLNEIMKKKLESIKQSIEEAL